METETEKVRLLTEEQWSLLDESGQNWIQDSRSTEPLDQTQIVSLIRELYDRYALPLPVIVWCQSPRQMNIMYIVMQMVLDCPWDLTAQLLEKAQLVESSESSELDSVWSQLKSQFGHGVYSQLTDFPYRRQMNFSLPADGADQNFAAEKLSARFIPVDTSSCGVGVNSLMEDTFDSTTITLLAARFGWRQNRSTFPQQPMQIAQAGAINLDTLISGITQRSTPDDLKALPKVWWGFRSVLWAPVFDLISVHLGLAKSPAVEKLSTWRRLGNQCLAYLFFEQVCFVCERPTRIHLDARNRLHHATEAALTFSDGWEIYSWHGGIVDKKIVQFPDLLTIADIEAEVNIEARRIMIERFGLQRFTIESGTAIVSQDEYGTLYGKFVPSDEPILLLKVTNSTAELDGTFKEYFLRVPPDMKTAHEAVAWTFQMTPEEYDLDMET